MNHFSIVSLIVVLVAAAGGCGGRESSVQGVVTLDGKPLEFGTVSFHLQPEGATSYGRIGPGGVYQLKTGDRQGLAAGSYKVTVIATEPTPADWPADKMPKPGKLVSPKRYGTLATTDLTVDVGPGSNQIDLPLTSK